MTNYFEYNGQIFCICFSKYYLCKNEGWTYAVCLSKDGKYERGQIIKFKKEGIKDLSSKEANNILLNE